MMMAVPLWEVLRTPLVEVSMGSSLGEVSMEPLAVLSPSAVAVEEA